MPRPDENSAAPAPTARGRSPWPGRPSTGAPARTRLQPLRIIGVALPVVFVVVLQLLRPTVIDARWPEQGDLLVTGFTILATLVFGIAMFELIERAQAATVRQNRELAAVNDVLLQISQHDDPERALVTVVRLARTVPGATAAGLCLDRRTADTLAIGREIGATPGLDAPLCITGEGAKHCTAGRAITDGPDIHLSRACGSVRVVGDEATVLTMALHGHDLPLGHIWVAGPAGTSFGVRDEAFVSTLAELAVVNLKHARMLGNERQAAIVAERDRIAREMHDSLAQVLGATQLRLYALSARPELATAEGVRAEVEEIAGVCREAYADVRESILGLRSSTRPDATFLDSLDSYVRRFARQSGIPTRLDAAMEQLSFVPQCEVQVLRVVQEALTNVRKHSGASSAVVRVLPSDRGMTLEVEDDGHGFEPGAVRESDRGGFGLETMRERAAMVGGSLTVDAAPGKGTRVAVSVPGTMRLPGPGEAGWGS